MGDPMRHLDTNSPAYSSGAAPGGRRVGDGPSVEPEAVDLEVEEESASTEEAGRLIQQCLQELRKQIAAGAQPLPQPTGARRLIWALGLGTIGVAMIVFAILLHQTQSLSAAGQSAARQEYAHCVNRQALVMRAIADYTRDHHEAPPSLGTLWPRYLQAPAADPATGEPFKYVRAGAMVTLSCPRHPLAPLQPLPALAERSLEQANPAE